MFKRTKADNIRVGRYQGTVETRSHDYVGWIEPESREWILFILSDGTVKLYAERDPITGAVLD